MAATRKDRGNSWASRAPLNDDRAPIVAKLVEAGRSNFFKLSLQRGARWLLCRLLTGGLTLSAAKLRSPGHLREDLASNVGTDPQKIFFVEW